MSKFELATEWENPAGARGHELRATWASLQIRVEGQLVTKLFDEQTKGMRDSLIMPLCPLAEWIAEHWWHLTKEPLVPGRSTSRAYGRRHDLVSAAEGFALPDLRIQPQGSVVLFAWSGSEFDNSPIRFVSSGTGVAETRMVEAELSRFVTSVVERLESSGIADSYLQQEWKSIQSLNSEEEDFCVASATLGLDPFNMGEEQIQAVLKTAVDIPVEPAMEFFSAAEPDRLLQNRAELDAGIGSAVDFSLADPLARARDQLRENAVKTALPWDVGHAAARAVRLLVGGDPRQDTDFAATASAFGIGIDRMGKAKLPGKPGWLDAVARVTGSSVAYAIQNKPEQSTRFALCRAIYELLTADEGSWCVVTRARTERQAQNRAFAAEFLVPADVLAKELSGTLVDNDEIEDVSRAFNVSSWVVKHQIVNNDLAEIAD